MCVNTRLYFKGVIMERREDTPVRVARRKYEAKVKKKKVGKRNFRDYDTENAF